MDRATIRPRRAPRGLRVIAPLMAALIFTAGALVACSSSPVSSAGPEATLTSTQQTAWNWSRSHGEMWSWMRSHWGEMAELHRHWNDPAWLRPNLADYAWMQNRWSDMVWVQSHWAAMTWMYGRGMMGSSPGGMMGQPSG